MMQTDRLEAIRHHLYAHGVTSLADLADAVGMSLATVRRDLMVLERQGIVSRTHGGARIARGTETETAFAVRETQNLARKRAIAQAAYDTLEPQTTVCLDAGTTVLQVVRLLRLNPLPLTVFTNGLVMAQALMTVPKLKVVLIGGQVRVENASLVGPAAEATLRGLWFDRLFLGATAIGDDDCIYSVDEAEASLNALMLKRASAATVLADSSKFDRRATYAVCRLAAPMRMLTDDGLSAAGRTRLDRAGVALTVVAPLGGNPRLATGGTA